MKTKTIKTSRRPPPAPRRATTAVLDLVPATLKLKTILVPTDFAEPSKKSLRYALRFAEQFGATVILLHVVEPIVLLGDAYGSVAVPMEATAALQQDATTRLASLVRDEIEEVVPVSSCVRCGKPYQEIVNAAREREVDLIIIATHGYTGLKHVFLGSTAERVVRHAPCPVLIVREKEHEFA